METKRFRKTHGITKPEFKPSANQKEEYGHLVSETNMVEDILIGEFDTKTLSKVSSLSDSELHALLLQKRHLSLTFTPLYDRALCALVDEEAKDVVRDIVREEYVTSNHREDLVQDLLTIRIPFRKIHQTKATPTTEKTIERTLRSVTYRHDYTNDIRILAALHMTGEILPGLEYGVIVPELEKRYGLTAEKSVFYYNHLAHDPKRVVLGESGQTHADRIGAVLGRLILYWEDALPAMKTIEEAYKIRTVFYEQFRA